ncbi:MAG: CAP domain-containing protein, partial [Coriobacteriia bacterium]|nr:CAP domain-containing protein [Coriobacteriia bacterium]
MKKISSKFINIAGVALFGSATMLGANPIAALADEAQDQAGDVNSQVTTSEVLEDAQKDAQKNAQEEVAEEAAPEKSKEERFNDMIAGAEDLPEDMKTSKEYLDYVEEKKDASEQILKEAQERKDSQEQLVKESGEIADKAQTKAEEAYQDKKSALDDLVGKEEAKLADLEDAQNKASQEQSDAREALEHANTELDEAKSELEQVKQNSDFDEESYSKAEQDLNEAQSEKDAANEALDAAENTLSEKEYEKESVQAKEGEVQAEVNELDDAIANKEQEVNHIEAGLQDAQAQLDEAKENIDQDEYDELKAGLKQAQENEQAALDAYQEAQAELSLAEQALQDAKRAKEQASFDAEKQYKEGAYAFYKSLGEVGEKAVAILEDYMRVGTYSFTEEHLQEGAFLTEPGVAGDSTNVENVLASIKYLRLANEYRAKTGLKPLLVSPEAMALAQANANWSRNLVKHRGGYGTGENLAWGGVESAFYRWYDEEKAYYDAHNLAAKDWLTDDDWRDAGHYLNLADVKHGHGYKYETMGFALSTKYRANSKFCDCAANVFADDYARYGKASAKWTVDEFEELFTAWLDSLNQSEAYAAKQANNTDEEASVDKVQLADEAYQAAEREYEQKHQLVVEKAAALEDAKEASRLAQDAFDAFGSEVSNLTAMVDGLNKQLEIQRINLRSLQNKKEDLNTLLGDLHKASESAQEAYDLALQDRDAKKLDAEAKEKAFMEAQVTYDALSAQYKEVKDAQAKLDYAQTRVDEYNQVIEATGALLEKIVAEIDLTQAQLQAAQDLQNDLAALEWEAHMSQRVPLVDESGEFGDLVELMEVYLQAQAIYKQDIQGLESVTDNYVQVRNAFDLDNAVYKKALAHYKTFLPKPSSTPAPLQELKSDYSYQVSYR